MLPIQTLHSSWKIFLEIQMIPNCLMWEINPFDIERQEMKSRVCLSVLVEVDGLLAGGDEGDGREAVELLVVLVVLVQSLDWYTPLGEARTVPAVSSRLRRARWEKWSSLLDPVVSYRAKTSFTWSLGTKWTMKRRQRLIVPGWRVSTLLSSVDPFNKLLDLESNIERCEERIEHFKKERKWSVRSDMRLQWFRWVEIAPILPSHSADIFGIHMTSEI